MRSGGSARSSDKSASSAGQPSPSSSPAGLVGYRIVAVDGKMEWEQVQFDGRKVGVAPGVPSRHRSAVQRVKLTSCQRQQGYRYVAVAEHGRFTWELRGP